ncbi:MAG: hypothetical protein ACOYD0_06155 [Candidatus Nanopelagicales bacterium]
MAAAIVASYAAACPTPVDTSVAAVRRIVTTALFADPDPGERSRPQTRHDRMAAAHTLSAARSVTLDRLDSGP